MSAIRIMVGLAARPGQRRPPSSRKKSFAPPGNVFIHELNAGRLVSSLSKEHSGIVVQKSFGVYVAVMIFVTSKNAACISDNVLDHKTSFDPCSSLTASERAISDYLDHLIWSPHARTTASTRHEA